MAGLINYIRNVFSPTPPPTTNNEEDEVIWKEEFS